MLSVMKLVVWCCLSSCVSTRVSVIRISASGMLGSVSMLSALVSGIVRSVVFVVCVVLGLMKCCVYVVIRTGNRLLSSRKGVWMLKGALLNVVALSVMSYGAKVGMLAQVRVGRADLS